MAGTERGVLVSVFNLPCTNSVLPISKSNPKQPSSSDGGVGFVIAKQAAPHIEKMPNHHSQPTSAMLKPNMSTLLSSTQLEEELMQEEAPRRVTADQAKVPREERDSLPFVSKEDKHHQESFKQYFNVDEDLAFASKKRDHQGTQVASHTDEPSPKRRSFEHSHGLLDDNSVDDQLHERLSMLYEELGKAFSDPRFKTMISPFHDTQASFNTQSDVTFEVVAGRVIPFGMSMASDEMWQAFSHGAVAVKERFGDYCETDTAFRTFLRPLENKIHVRGKVAARRYIEPTRVVLVSSSVNVPIDDQGRRMQDFVLRSESWAVISVPRDHQGNPITDSGVVQTQLRQCITIQQRNVEGHKTDSGEPLASFMVRVMSKTFSQRQHTIENLLL